MRFDVFRQAAAGHPFRDQLERGGCDTEERDDVLVVQTLPYDDLLVERLWLSSAAASRESGRITYFLSLPMTIFVIHPNTFNANF